MTFKDVHQMIMDELDRAYQELREIHADPAHLNPDSAEHKRAQEWFKDVQWKAWKLKEVWALF